MARQGPTACEGMAAPMDKLDDLVANHLEVRLLQPERLEMILARLAPGRAHALYRNWLVIEEGAMIIEDQLRESSVKFAL